MDSCKDRCLTLGELRKEFGLIYPTAKQLHMNVIAAVLRGTDFKDVEARYGIHYDFYRLRHIINTCNLILNKEN